MTKDEEIVQRQYQRDSFPFSHTEEMGREADEVLKVDDIGPHPLENPQEGSIKEVVIVKDPRIRDSGQIVHCTGDFQSFPLFLLH